MSSDPSKSVAYDEIEIQLRELQDKDRLRTLRERAGVDFTSNDYLGLAESVELRQAAADALGAAGAYGGWSPRGSCQPKSSMVCSRRR